MKHVIVNDQVEAFLAFTCLSLRTSRTTTCWKEVFVKIIASIVEHMIYIEAFNEIEKTTSRGELSSNSSFAYYKI